MKTKKILVISNQYPFGKGENFLQDEIETIKSFTLYICPIEKKKGETIKRELPSNVIVLLPEKGEWKDKINLVKEIISPIKYCREFKKLIKNNKFNVLTVKRAIVTEVISCIKAYRLINIIKKNKLAGEERLIIYSYWSASSALAAIKVKDRLENNIKVISRAHGIDLYEERHEYNYLPYKEEIYHGLDRIYPISENGKQYIIERYDITGNKCNVQRLGTHDYGINKFSITEELVLVSCSSVIPLKRINLIIETLKLITNIRIKWIHLGDGELLTEVKEKAKNDLKNNITYEFKGYCEKQWIINFYRREKIDLFINVSEYEGIPVSIMEALSFGIPAIAPNVGGIVEIVEDRFNGWIIEKNNIIEMLKAAIGEYVYLSEIQKKQIRSNARKSWEEKYNADVNYSEFYNELQKI